MYNKAKQISTFGKVVAIVSAIIGIILISGKWLNLYQIPLIFGDSVQHQYSLFEISDFLDNFNMYLNNSDIQAYSTMFSIGAVIVIILEISLCITSIADSKIGKTISVINIIASLVVSCVFLGIVFNINSEVKEATYGGINELLKTTARPYWLVIFSVIGTIGVRMKPNKIQNASYTANNKIKCTNCGADIEQNASFCNNCGAKIEITANQSKTIDTVFCTNCGNRIPSDSEFCTACGNKVEK